MAATAMIHARVDESVKKQAAEALAKMGLTLSGGVNLFLARVARDQAIPFEVKVPNAETRAALEEAEATLRSGNLRYHGPADLAAALDDIERH